MASPLAALAYIGPHKDFLAAQDLITPLSHDGKNVDMLLNFVDFISRQGFGPPPAEEPQLP